MDFTQKNIIEPQKKYNMEQQFNPSDKITVDVPLFIRLLEYAREDAKTDMDLHKVTENAVALSTTGKTLTMADYDGLVAGNAEDKEMNEIKRMQQLAGVVNENHQPSPEDIKRDVLSYKPEELKKWIMRYAESVSKGNLNNMEKLRIALNIIKEKGITLN